MLVSQLTRSHNSSDKVPGSLAALEIPLRSNITYPYVDQIIVKANVAGNEWKQTLNYSAVTPNQKLLFNWNGTDAYGRLLQGQQNVTVSIGFSTKMYYVDYPALLASSESAYNLFMAAGVVTVPFASPISSQEAPSVTTWMSYEVPISYVDLRPEALGGWTISEHHSYNPATKTLNLGDGTQRSALSVNAAVQLTCSGIYPDQSYNQSAGLLASAAADGSIVFSDFNQSDVSLIYRRAMDGTVSVVGGNGTNALAEGMLATNAFFSGVAGLTVGPDGSIFFANNDDYRIWKIRPDGTLKIVAGNGSYGYDGDGGPATDASLFFYLDFYQGTENTTHSETELASIRSSRNGAGASVLDPVDMAVSPDGTLFFIDFWNQALRRVGNDGVITTVAGGSGMNTADGIYAKQAALNYPSGLAISPQGIIYVGDSTGIRIITPDGLISHLTNFNYSVVSLALAPDQSLYALANGNGYGWWGGAQNLYEIKPTGEVTQIAGGSGGGDLFNPSSRYGNPDGFAAFKFPLNSLSVTVDPNNNVYFAQGGVWRVSKPLPDLAADNITIASEDGGELYNFTGTGKHISTVDAVTGKTLFDFGYDNNGLLVTITNLYGDVTCIQRDAGTGNATAIISADGQQTTLGYDANGWLNHVANPAGQAYSITYTPDGLLTQFTNPRQNSSTITYDSAGRLHTDSDAAGGSSTLGRTDYDDGVMISLLTGMNYNPASYAVRQIVGANNSIGYEYRENVAPDGSTNRVWMGKDGSTTEIAADGTTTFTQDGPDPRWGLQAPFTATNMVTLPSGNQLTVSSLRFVGLSNINDPLSMMAETNLTTINGNTFSTIYNFDGITRSVTAASPLGRTSVATLDGNGRVLQSAVPEVAPVNYQYDTRGRLLAVSQSANSQTRTMSYAYDTTQNGGASSGRLTGITDPLGNTTTFTYDPNLSGRVVQQTYSNGRFIQYQYDANGNLTGITPPQKPTHLFAFNVVDMLDQYTPPLAPKTGNNYTTYAYNLNKQITTLTRPDGLQINYAYDPQISWLTNVSLPLGENIAYTYVQNGCGCSGVGRPQSLTFNAVDYTSAINYTYDGSLVTGVAWSGPVSGTVTAGYDNFFRVNALSVNGSNPVAFGYDADGLLVQAGDLTLTRDGQNGMLTGTTLNNVNDAWSYTAFGEAQSYVATAGTTALYAMSFTRDNVGRIATKTETIGGVTSVYGYSYDVVRGWLTDVTSNGMATAHYDYDDNGNRTHVLTLDREVNYAAADGQDRIASATLTLPMQVPLNVSWKYSANGEVQSKTVGGLTTGYSYDVRGSLRDVTLTNGVQIKYLVDATGRRIGKEVNGALAQGWLYQDGLKPIAELDGNGNVVSFFVYAGKANVPEYMIENGNEYRLITDQLGSVRLVVNAADGTIAQELDYDEFGRVLSDSNPGFQPFGYAGGLYDADTKLVRFGARDYDANSGRWLNRDPIQELGGLNLYAYVGNDPVNLVDLFGLSQQDVNSILNGYNQATTSMNQAGHRVGWFPPFSSLNSDLYPWPSSGNGWECVSQSKYLAQQLNNQQYDDQWTINTVTRPDLTHTWVEAVSSNPYDPSIKLDPWWGSVTVSPHSPISNINVNAPPQIHIPL